VVCPVAHNFREVGGVEMVGRGGDGGRSSGTHLTRESLEEWSFVPPRVCLFMYLVGRGLQDCVGPVDGGVEEGRQAFRSL
jgi:hypothetical protein